MISNLGLCRWKEQKGQRFSHLIEILDDILFIFCIFRFSGRRQTMLSQPQSQRNLFVYIIYTYICIYTYINLCWAQCISVHTCVCVCVYLTKPQITGLTNYFCFLLASGPAAKIAIQCEFGAFEHFERWENQLGKSKEIKRTVVGEKKIMWNIKYTTSGIIYLIYMNLWI